MKLITLNTEGRKHLELVQSFLEAEEADCICLQEAPEFFKVWLLENDYFVTFAPILIRDKVSPSYFEGVMFASKRPHQADVIYYRRSLETIVVEDSQNRAETYGQAYIKANVSDDSNNSFTIITTHLVKSEDGLADALQTECLQSLLQKLQLEPPHILCGDFNMPRGYNSLYEIMTSLYSDTVPKEYTSSLDRDLHRHGNNPHLDQPIFDSYMVDYIFSQPPYQASNVRLQFGVSDHAAVVADITKAN